MSVSERRKILQSDFHLIACTACSIKEAVEKLLRMDPEAKAIVTCGYCEGPVLSNYRDYGFSGVVAKPFETHQMSRVLHDVLRSGRG